MGMKQLEGDSRLFVHMKLPARHFADHRYPITVDVYLPYDQLPAPVQRCAWHGMSGWLNWKKDKGWTFEHNHNLDTRVRATAPRGTYE